MLNASKDTQKVKIISNLKGLSGSYTAKELEIIAEQASQEYELNSKGVKGAFKNFIYEYDTADKS
jgi:hypothetical protein